MNCFLRIELSNEQWARIEDLVPDQVKRAHGRGGSARDKREVMEGVPYILRTGAPWKDLTDPFLSYQTCHRRFQQWQEQGVMHKVVEA